MIMTDQDQDGSHIKGLIINFLHHHWPSLIQHNFVEEFITPIVKVFKGKVEHAFYSLPEFEEWKQETHNWHTWRVKYYKGNLLYDSHILPQIVNYPQQKLIAVHCFLFSTESGRS